MKTCNKCEIEKENQDFPKCKSTKDGLAYRCKSCDREIYLLNKDKKLKQAKIYRDNNKSIIKSKSKKYRQQNKKNLKISKKKYYNKNKALISKKAKINYKENKEIVLEKNKKYYICNKEKINSKRSEWKKNKRKTDSLYKLKENIRCRIYAGFKNSNTNKHKFAEEILGCSFEVAKNYIENQFIEGMTWSNHGSCIDGDCTRTWQIDHKIGLCNAKNEEELIKLCHYTNLQPLWTIDNLKKEKYKKQ